MVKQPSDAASRARQLARRNNDLEEVIYVASHDLQESLRNIQNLTMLLEKRYGGQLDDEAEKLFGFLTESGNRSNAVVQGLLEYSRLGRNSEYSNVDCHALATAIQHELATLLNSTSTTLNVHCLPVVHGAEAELRLLFNNLIGNAIRFRSADRPPVIEVAAQQTPHHHQFSVKDNGIGIPEAQQEKVFVIFRRLHHRNAYEGSGVGLALCRKVVELHGGRIWVDARPGEGSTFQFTLPRKP